MIVFDEEQTLNAEILGAFSKVIPMVVLAIPLGKCIAKVYLRGKDLARCCFQPHRGCSLKSVKLIRQKH
jgi:hypothetical protein